MSKYAIKKTMPLLKKKKKMYHIKNFTIGPSLHLGYNIRLYNLEKKGNQPLSL